MSTSTKVYELATRARSKDETMNHWRDDNTTGYTPAERDALNAEFRTRYEVGDWPGATQAEAAQWFADEVARR